MGGGPAITTSWATYSVLFRCNTTATDGRITFQLGGGLPNGAKFYVDTLSFKVATPADGRRFPDIDVGNIIFNNGQSVGWKQWSQSDLANQGDFYYDASTWTVKLYSTANPASHYSDSELALDEHIIDETNQHYVTYQNLDLSDGGAYGIKGGETYDITVNACNFSFLGGGVQSGQLRYGNGVEFFDDAHDNLVENCKLWQIYDAALSNQGDSGATEYNITYRNNLIWDCEYSYEFWQAPPAGTSSTMNNIYFENNTCVDAGSGWSHAQRPDPSGRHVSSPSNGASISNYYICNNVFAGAAQDDVFLGYFGYTDAANLTLDNNLYYQTSIYWLGTAYSSVASFCAATGKDAHSIVGLPQFVDPANHDYHLLFNSPAIDAGTNTGVATDYDGTARPQGAAYDIGAYEYTPLPMVTGVLVASSTWSSDFLNSLGGVGYAIPDGPNQLCPLPGSNLNEVIIEFNKDVNVTESDLVLTGVNVPSYGFSAFSYDAVAHRATWTISQNLVQGQAAGGLGRQHGQCRDRHGGQPVGWRLGEPDMEPAVGAQRRRRLAIGRRHGRRRLPIPHQRPAGRRQPGRHGGRAGLGHTGGELSEKPRRLGQRRPQLRRRGGRHGLGRFGRELQAWASSFRAGRACAGPAGRPAGEIDGRRHAGRSQ